MTQKEKDLLIKDLCARLPYGVHIHSYCPFDQDSVSLLYSLRECKDEIRINDLYYIEEIKPYLFPLSSLTEEQRDAFRNVGGVMSYNPQTNKWAISAFAPEAYDWLNTHHFDYRHLIEKGLAIDATGLNIY